jgi:hypothetical protein
MQAGLRAGGRGGSDDSELMKAMCDDTRCWNEAKGRKEGVEAARGGL